jgi:hypothetical protein
MRDLLRIQAFVLCCFLGGLAGAALSGATLGRWALERYRAEHPGECVCGMFLHPYLFLGLLAGAVGGAVAGWRVQRWLAGPRRQQPPPSPAAEPDAAADRPRD